MLGENDNDVSLIKLYANNGSGVFTEVTNTPFNNEKIGDVAIADTDNDGDLDVLISGEVGNSELYSNDGTGTFSLVTGTPIPGAIAGETDFADFDNDGDVDVLITGVGNGGIISNIYENLGGNNFILADSLAGAYLSSTAIGDINGDNLADVVIAGTSFTAPIRGTKTYLNITQTTVGFANEQSLQTVSIYPNPSSGIINIDCEQKVGSSIKVFNTIGELVYSDDNLNPNRPIQLKQSPGLYMVIIKTNNLTSTHKLIFK